MNEIINDLDFEKRIGNMADRQLLEFVARQSLEVNKRCVDHISRIISLESTTKRQSGIIGGISGTFTAIAISVINYFTTNRG